MSTQYSAIARPVVLSLPSNRVPATGFVLAAAAARRRGRGWKQAALCGAEVFAAWSIARELDPDHHASAAAAAGAALALQLAGAGQQQPRTADFLANAASLMSARVLSATVGPAPNNAEATVLGLSAGLAAYAGAAVSAAGVGAALLLSAREGGRSKATAAQGAGALAAALLGPVAAPTQPAAQPPTARPWLQAGALAAAAGLTLLRPPHVTAPTDDGRSVCASRRVQLSRLLLAGVGGAALTVQRPRSVRATALALLCASVR